MALPLRKLESTADRTAHARHDELVAERRQVIAAIVQLENEGFRPTPPPAGPTLQARAAALIQTQATPTDAVADQGTTLFHLFERKDAIDCALEILKQQIAQEDAARLRSMMDSERPQWLAACRKRVLLARSLQAANAEFETFKRRYAQLGTLPTSSFRLLGMGVPGDEVTRASEELERLGMVTKREIA